MRPYTCWEIHVCDDRGFVFDGKNPVVARSHRPWHFRHDTGSASDIRMDMQSDTKTYVVIDGITYPALTKWEQWRHEQHWLCRFGWHYFLPAGPRQAFGIQTCVCGRCGCSTWWTGNIWKLMVRYSYWRQAGRTVPRWKDGASAQAVD